jgi:hypothetical protein
VLHKAINTIQKACMPEGILASSLVKDNYHRVWARDSMMAGIVGILYDDEIIIKAHLNSLYTLANHQLATGAIPSNVSIAKDNTQAASYGTLVGRVDATTWWLIGACIYGLSVNKDAILKLQPNMYKALDCLTTWEFNHKGLIYTPLGGNWADEYILNGYTLYDNVLRYAALHLMSKLWQDEGLAQQAKDIKNILQKNFDPNNNQEPKYHNTAFEIYKNKNLSFFAASLNANGYGYYWDMAANALAILFNVLDNENTIGAYLHTLVANNNKQYLLPVFYPIIETDNTNSYESTLLNSNYLYSFKNKPHHFHNGGSWPIMLGWLCIAINARWDNTIIANNIKSAYNQALSIANEQELFSEYFDTITFKPAGVNQLCYSATGYLLMEANANQINFLKQLFN